MKYTHRIQLTMVKLQSTFQIITISGSWILANKKLAKIKWTGGMDKQPKNLCNATEAYQQGHKMV